MRKTKEKIVKKTGRVVIVGRPNAGKSTLLNNIFGQKVAITSPKPQTTRRNLTVPYSEARGEIFFVDTPGMFQKISDEVGRMVNKMPGKGVIGADILVYLVDLSRPKTEEENKAIGLVRKSPAKKILAYNKIDKFGGRKQGFRPDYAFLEEEVDRVIAISALKSTHLKGLLDLIFELLPEKKERENKEGDKEREEGKETGKDSEEREKQDSVAWEGLNKKEWIAELVREKAYLALRQELPYTVGVLVEEVEDKKKLIVVKAKLFTTSDRYKAMIVGKGGAMIKKIGSETRKELELAWNRKVFLELRVETNRHWPQMLMGSSKLA